MLHWPILLVCRLTNSTLSMMPRRYSGKMWKDKTGRTRLDSVAALLREQKAFGVTFMIPRVDQRPWSPLVGYHCVYESFFCPDSRVWFPISRLITSYCLHRDIAISRLMNGAVRIVMALMVMAAEINISMSVRVFEEMTQTQPKPNSLYAIQMRSRLHILTGHPSKTRDWHDGASFEEPPSDGYRFLWSPCIVIHPNTIVYPETFWEDVPNIDVLSQNKWGNFSNNRICRHQKRITKVDWASIIPWAATKGKRLKLPIMGRVPRTYQTTVTFSTLGLELITRKILRTWLKGSVKELWARRGEDRPAKATTRGGTLPSKKPLIATSKEGIPFVNDPEACAELMRQIRGGPIIPGFGSGGPCCKFAFSPFLSLVLETIVHFTYPFILLSGNRAQESLCFGIRDGSAEGGNRNREGEETIKAKDAEFERTKKEILKKAKEVVAERNHHFREYKQAVRKAKNLESKLKAARATIQQLEKDKAAEAERSRKKMTV
ncbi:hypothetical protein N665_0623s0003 [Sinapis alba]|nr:hypothetical protein N665_0623s0003 [Sinapis alba]